MGSVAFQSLYVIVPSPWLSFQAGSASWAWGLCLAIFLRILSVKWSCTHEEKQFLRYCFHEEAWNWTLEKAIIGVFQNDLIIFFHITKNGAKKIKMLAFFFFSSSSSPSSLGWEITFFFLPAWNVFKTPTPFPTLLHHFTCSASWCSVTETEANLILYLQKLSFQKRTEMSLCDT